MKKRVNVRKPVSVVLAAGLLATLSACATGPAGGDCAPLFPSGSNSALVTATGAIGADPAADFATPIVGGKTQVSVVSTGDGDPMQAGAVGILQVTIYNGQTGDVLISSDYSGSGVLSSAVDATPAFGAVAQCAPVGSRVAAVGTATALLGEDAITQYQLPIKADDDVVLVADLLQTFLGKSNGVDQPAQPGFPSVVLAPNGRPGITFSSDSTAPTEFRSATLKAGSGEKVKEGEGVVLHYTAVQWGTKTVTDTTWDGLPVVKLATDVTENENGLPDGLAKAIVGQKVGSQVIAVLPGDTTNVYVVDILGIYQ